MRLAREFYKGINVIFLLSSSPFFFHSKQKKKQNKTKKQKKIYSPDGFHPYFPFILLTLLDFGFWIYIKMIHDHLQKQTQSILFFL